MRVRDWRAHGGLDVLVHALGGGAALDDEVMRSVMEARGLLLADAARLAAERRDETQAALLGALAAEVAVAPDDAAAQGADFAFFATLIAASGNLVLLLVANSIRDLYFARLADFRALVRDRAALGPRYAEAAAAVAAGDGDAAARVVRELAAAQEAAWLEGAGMRAREARAAARADRRRRRSRAAAAAGRARPTPSPPSRAGSRSRPSPTAPCCAPTLLALAARALPARATAPAGSRCCAGSAAPRSARACAPPRRRQLLRRTPASCGTPAAMRPLTSA